MTGLFADQSNVCKILCTTVDLCVLATPTYNPQVCCIFLFLLTLSSLWGNSVGESVSTFSCRLLGKGYKSHPILEFLSCCIFPCYLQIQLGPFGQSICTKVTVKQQHLPFYLNCFVNSHVTSLSRQVSLYTVVRQIKILTV